MAPIGEPIYFPSLDKCLDGGFQLLSWKSTFTGCVEHDENHTSHPNLRAHLEDLRTVEILAHFPNAPPTSTTRSQTDFENLTSAINITPTSRRNYSIEEIKEDALWLSKSAGIEEVSALRIAILEWQIRPATRLLRLQTEEEGLVWNELRGGASTWRTSKPASQFGSRISGNVSSGNFDTVAARRLRLVNTHFSERQYLSKTCQYIVFRASCNPQSEESLATERPSPQTLSEDDWLAEIGSTVLKHWKSKNQSPGSGNPWIVDAIATLRQKFEALKTGNGLPQSIDAIEELGLVWSKTHILEILHILQTILILTTTSSNLTRSDEVLSWFRFVNDGGFFEKLDFPYQDINGIYAFPFQSLVALVSLAILRIPLALESLQEIYSSGQAISSNSPDTSFISNPLAFEEITSILIQIAEAPSQGNASLALFGWGILLQNLRVYSTASQETREVKQSQRALDTFGASQSSDNDSNDNFDGQRRVSPHRRSSIASDNSQQITFLEELYETVQRCPADGDAVSLLVRSAVDRNHVFNVIAGLAIDFCTPFGSEYGGKSGRQMRLGLLQLVRAALEWIEYQPEIVQAALAILQGGERIFDLPVQTASHYDVTSSSVFLNDAFLMHRIFDVALSHFPYETLPFLKICRALAVAQSHVAEATGSIISLLHNIQTFTSVLDERQSTYRLCDDGDATSLELTSVLGVLPDSNSPEHRKNKLLSGKGMPKIQKFGEFQLVEGTRGRALTNEKPLVVLWDWNYSGLRYLSLLLQRLVQAPGCMENSTEVTIEVIGLLTVLLKSDPHGRLYDRLSLDSPNTARFILEEASDALDRNEDIVSLIFSIYEAELHKRHFGPSEDGSTELLVQCTEFVHALLGVVPGRVWPFLMRSALLGSEGTQSRLSAVVATAEITSGRYQFLLSCIRLFDAVIEDALQHVVARKHSTTVVTRFGTSAPDMTGTSVTENTMKETLLGLERVLIDVFESCRNWKFISLEEKLEVNTTICQIFNKILMHSFAVDDAELPRKLTGFLAPAANYLLQVFLSKSANGLPIQPLLHMLLEGTTTPVSTLSIKGFHCWVSQTSAALQLSTTLVRVNHYLGQSSTILEHWLFKATPILVKLYASHNGYRMPVIELLEALIRCAGSSDVQPPSLLGHLGQEAAKSFLELLSMLSQPLGDSSLETAIWRLMSAAVSQRQQWFAICLLTGDTPRETLQNKNKTCESNVKHVQPMLSLAMDRLCNMERLASEVVVSMLEFVSLSADFWPWVIMKLMDNVSLTTTLIDFISKLSSESNGSTKSDLEPHRTQKASFIVNILAMYVHRCHQNNDRVFLKQIIPSLTYLIQNGVATPNYNASLHGSLRKNFEAKFPGCNLSNFKKTSMIKTFLGKDFYYDGNMANKLLSYDPVWNGRRGQGFADEFSRANINLSLVEAQVNLFHSWKSLAVQLSLALGSEKNLHKSLTVVIRDCLRANAENLLPEAIFTNLAQSRADLAFALLEQVTQVSRHSEETKSILQVSWTAMQSYTQDLGLALAGENADYARTLLKILYLALQAHAPELPTAVSETLSVQERMEAFVISQMVLEILGKVVAKGFRSLTTALHDDASRVLPADFVLINAVMRTCFRVPGVEAHTEQLLTLFTDSSTARYASTLLSWSDKLMIGTDPVFGDISMAFLLQLSTIPSLAESIAVGGILTQVSSAALMNYFRRPDGIGPYQEPVRIYNIWSRSVLPLVINILGACGPPIASEVGGFLNLFKGQLARTASNFDAKPSPTPYDPKAGYITLTMACEVHSLALISGILDMFREAGASAGIVASEVPELDWDKTQIKGDLDGWLRRRNALRENILPTNEKEEAWSRQKPEIAASGAENLLEEKVVEELQAAAAMLGDGEF